MLRNLRRGIALATQILTGQHSYALVIAEDGEVETVSRRQPLDPRTVEDYTMADYATLVRQGRARCIEWHVVQGQEVGFDHDLMVWCLPGTFQDV